MARFICSTISGECGGPGTDRETMSSGWLGWTTVHHRYSPKVMSSFSWKPKTST